MSFGRVLGQSAAVAALRAELRSGRLAGAYLFVGPPGVGKGLVATEFVRALNCLNGGDDGCDGCPPCRQIERGEFPDLYRPQAQGRRIGKGAGGPQEGMALGDIVARLRYPPVAGRVKVVIIDPADGLTPEAGNMLLKTLEEPPRETHFILLASLESTVLPTIVSRCRRLRFTPLPPAALESFLVSRQSLPAELARALAGASQGSIARALELSQSRLMESRLQIVDFLLGVIRQPLEERIVAARALLQALGGKDPRAAVERVGSIMAMVARDLLSLSCGAADGMLLFPERSRELAGVAALVGRPGVLAFATLAEEFQEGLRRNENPNSLMHFLGIVANRLAGSPGAPQARSSDG